MEVWNGRQRAHIGIAYMLVEIKTVFIKTNFDEICYMVEYLFMNIFYLLIVFYWVSPNKIQLVSKIYS